MNLEVLIETGKLFKNMEKALILSPVVTYIREIGITLAPGFSPEIYQRLHQNHSISGWISISIRESLLKKVKCKKDKH